MEGTHHPVEFTALVALRLPSLVFGLAGAELAEVFGGSGSDVCEELHFHAAEGLAAEGEVEEDDGVGGWLVCHFEMGCWVGGVEALEGLSRKM